MISNWINTDMIAIYIISKKLQNNWTRNINQSFSFKDKFIEVIENIVRFQKE